MRLIKLILLFQFLFVSLSPNSFVNEYAKLKNLITHYQSHYEQNPISFWDFLALHYGNHPHHQQEHEQHQNLPFHLHHLDSQITFTFFLNSWESDTYEIELSKSITTIFSFYHTPFFETSAIEI